MRKLVEAWTGWGIRKQLTAMSVVFVAIPILLGIVVLANMLTRALSTAQINASTDLTHRMVAATVQHGPEALPGDLDLDAGHRAQLIDHLGRVVWSSNPRFHLPMSQLRPQPGQVLQEGAVTWWGPEDRNEHRDLVITEGFTLDGRAYVALVASSQEAQHSAVTVTAGLLVACVPLIMLSTGAATWWAAGRALRPVDRMNSQVARITSSTLDERLPLPPTQDELQGLARTLNQMLARLERAQDSQQRFVSDASHELRSPLASLAGALEIASHEDDLETWRELAPLMRDEATRLTDLVGNMLTLSRGDDLGVRLHPVETDLDDLATDEVARLRSIAGLSVESHVTATRLVADPNHLRQVLRNLCDNAVRHAKSRVSLTLVPRKGGGAVLRVEDDGNGIAPADRVKVFQRFVRLEESRNRDEGGSGLGLAIVAQIVQAHGGTVEALGSPLGGACFEVRLPGAPDQSMASR